MSQFTLTAEQDALVLSVLRNRATQVHAMLGTADSDLEALIADMQAQLPQPEPVVEEVIAETPPDVVEPTDEEVEAHFAEEVVEEPVVVEEAKDE